VPLTIQSDMLVQWLPHVQVSEMVRVHRKIAMMRVTVKCENLKCTGDLDAKLTMNIYLCRHLLIVRSSRPSLQEVIWILLTTTCWVGIEV